MFRKVFHVDEEWNELDVERGCEFESKAWRHFRQHHDEGPGILNLSSFYKCYYYSTIESKIHLISICKPKSESILKF